MKNKKRKTAVVMGTAAAVCLTSATLALFTDRYQSQAEVTAGSLDLTLTETWQADNAAIADVFKPGTAMKLDYTLENDGNLAASVRENFVITADKMLSADEDRELDLYAAKDVTLDAEGNIVSVSGTPLTPTYGSFTEGSETHYTLSYALDEHVLNGTGDSAESVDGGLDVRNGEYVLVFNDDVGNDFQKVNLDVEYMAQALQHGGTGEATWEDAKVISESVNFGGQNINVVPVLEQGGTN